MSDDNQDLPNPQRDPVLRSYLASVCDWHGYIRFLGLPHLRENPDLVIDRLFVEPRLAASHISPESPPASWPATTELLDTLAGRPRLVLLGDPGSGKSTLVSWLAWQFAQPRETPWTARLGPLVPLPLVLRELTLGPDLTWDGLMAAFLGHAMCEPLRERVALEGVLTRGQGFLMLDGLDELGDLETRRALGRAVRDGIQRYPKCRWLLTSRIVGYDEASFDEREGEATPDPAPGADAGKAAGAPSAAPAPALVQVAGPNSGPVVSVKDGRGLLDMFLRLANDGAPRLSAVNRAYVAPFTDAQIERFAHCWYEVREPVKSRAAEGARDLLEAVRGDPTTQRLARIPNLLTMMALIHRVRARLPHGRALLYGEIAQAYLQSIDEFRGIVRTDYSLAQKRRWLARVGFEMQRRRVDGEGAADLQPGSAILAEATQVQEWVMAAMADSGLGPDPAAADDFIRYIGRRSGLLLPRGPGVFAFLHLSFQEYFAALFLMEQVMSPRWIRQGTAAPGAARDDLRAYARQSAWQETLLFLFELLADQPGWPETLAEEIFGADLNQVVAEVPVEKSTVGRFARALRGVVQHVEIRQVNQPIAVLLARIAVDPHSGLSGSLRRRAIERCMRRELTNQKELQGLVGLLAYQPEIARWLFGVQADQALAWECLVKGAAEIGLDQLTLRRCDQIDDISALASLSGLRSLDLTDTPIRDLSSLRQLNHLEYLSLPIQRELDVTPITGLTHLEYLSFCANGTGLDGLRKLPNLSTLIISVIENQDFDFLNGLVHIEYLALAGGMGQKVDLSLLIYLKKLRWLSLHSLGIDDLTPLYRCMHLNYLGLTNTKLAAGQLEALQRARPELKVDVNDSAPP